MPDLRILDERQVARLLPMDECIEVMAGAHALGGFTSLTEGESFAVEYWPLELYKLSLAPPPGELQGKVERLEALLEDGGGSGS